jgi:putative endonuclease
LVQNKSLTQHCSFAPMTTKKTIETPPKHLVTGKLGENIAVTFLQKKGWRIDAKNWKGGRGEIDIIAWDTDNKLVFVEVKTRSSESFGGPEGSITARKQALIAKTAGLYMESIDYNWEIRFDVVAVILRRGILVDLRHIEDAFFPF